MFRKTLLAITAVLCLALVFGAEEIRKKPGWDLFAMPILFPGYIVNIVIPGVHGNWDTFLGKSARLVPSFAMWFGPTYLFVWALFREKKPIQLPDTKRGE